MADIFGPSSGHMKLTLGVKSSTLFLGDSTNTFHLFNYIDYNVTLSYIIIINEDNIWLEFVFLHNSVMYISKYLIFMKTMKVYKLSDSTRELQTDNGEFGDC